MELTVFMDLLTFYELETTILDVDGNPGVGRLGKGNLSNQVQ